MKRFAFSGMLVLSLLLSIAFSQPTYSHGGGLDGYGCHRNNKEGNYHCHRGPDAGKTFPSKAAYEKYRREKKSK